MGGRPSQTHDRRGHTSFSFFLSTQCSYSTENPSFPLLSSPYKKLQRLCEKERKEKTPNPICLQTTPFSAVRCKGGGVYMYVRKGEETPPRCVGKRAGRGEAVWTLWWCYVVKYGRFYGSGRVAWRKRLLGGWKGVVVKGGGESGRRHVFDGQGVEARRRDMVRWRAAPAWGRGASAETHPENKGAGGGGTKGTKGRSRPG